MSGQRDRSLTRDLQNRNSRPERDDASNIPAYVAGCEVFRFAAQELARHAPAMAMRRVAAGLKAQTRGGKVSAVLQLVRSLAEAEPGIAKDVFDALGEEA